MPSPTTTPPRAIRLDPRDSVAIAIDAIKPGEMAGGVAACEPVQRGHKMALVALEAGAPIRKFGQIIGFATQPIAPGAWVHVHNVGLRDFERDYQFAVDAAAEDVLPPALRATFEGYVRPDGRVGTRNYVGVLSTVNCASGVARFIAEEATRQNLLAGLPGIDGIVPFVHGTGCGLNSKGEGFEALRRTMTGMAGHPNLAAVLIVGLGCEVFEIARMKAEGGIVEGDHLQTLTIQAAGGTRKTVADGVARLREMLPLAARARRQTRPASDLVLALQCGGSDGYSGITANPALGLAADELVRHGGTAILSETPEIYGAEHLLTRRAASREIGEALVARIHWWEDYMRRNGGEMNNNPSPGNKAGGLTTILEKSLGASAKGGSTTLRAVYEYAERVAAKGFVFMDTPGYDPVAATGQVAGGANLIAFTTGRGSVFGCKPVPSLKLATNTPLYRNMTDDMDINCGDVLDGTPLADKGHEIFEALLRTASGAPTKSEQLGYGDVEFVPWTIGATT